MFSYLIYLDDNIMHMEREAKNFATAFAALGGLLGLCTAFSTVVASYFLKIALENDFIKELFFNSRKMGMVNSYQDSKSLLLSLSHAAVNKTPFLEWYDILVLRMTNVCPCFRRKALKEKY